MKEHEIEAAWQGLASCERCQIRDLVLFADLAGEDFGVIHLPIEDLWLPPGAPLYQPDQAATHIHTVREGLFKLEQYLPDGNRRIVSLLRQGDVAGLEAIVADRYEHAAVALQASKVCRIPKDVVARLSPKLNRQLMNKWHEAVRRSHECTRELSTGSARQRLARLFGLLAPPLVPRCRLFGREDVGALLGITTETASRVVAEFKRSSIITEVAPNLFERDLAALERIAAEG
ncbi:Crp/Fnr family transcriptional regulator [Paramagnetospirillum marisnigri]|uniref:Crp/Fnr family transcriptional regulator n=1 Tax=Paramagnetospirillum marisnigri TaxID=1285242 RepID=A0A178MRR2_9PROT|nr:Crp/Fnr family transcriptional regulator [Paramagnetospirillum marisnigri]OAN52189.1 Crp/Fnr family transcriptional regulator [Paramagnetospirillum marisnigri]